MRYMLPSYKAEPPSGFLEEAERLARYRSGLAASDGAESAQD